MIGPIQGNVGSARREFSRRSLLALAGGLAAQADRSPPPATPTGRSSANRLGLPLDQQHLRPRHHCRCRGGDRRTRGLSWAPDGRPDHFLGVATRLGPLARGAVLAQRPGRAARPARDERLRLHAPTVRRLGGPLRRGRPRRLRRLPSRHRPALEGPRPPEPDHPARLGDDAGDLSLEHAPGPQPGLRPVQGYLPGGNADVYPQELPGCEIEWNHLRQPHTRIGQLYPGNGYDLDVVKEQTFTATGRRRSTWTRTGTSSPAGPSRGAVPGARSPPLSMPLARRAVRGGGVGGDQRRRRSREPVRTRPATSAASGSSSTATRTYSATSATSTAAASTATTASTCGLQPAGERRLPPALAPLQRAHAARRCA